MKKASDKELQDAVEHIARIAEKIKLIEEMNQLIGAIDFLKLKPKFTEKELKKFKKTKLYPLVKEKL